MAQGKLIRFFFSLARYGHVSRTIFSIFSNFVSHSPIERVRSVAVTLENTLGTAAVAATDAKLAMCTSEKRRDHRGYYYI
jgi:hypothetical protein